MAVVDHLVDKSAWARLAKPAVVQVVLPLLTAGRLAVCGMTELEVLHSVRSAEEHRQVRLELRGLERLPTPDLIIAAVAERHDLPVLHYDRDFEVIAEVTGQPVEWVVPPGTAD